MKKAVVVDKDYGSVAKEDLDELQQAYREQGIELELRHFTSEEEIIEGCRGAAAILGTGNPPITARVLKALPELKIVQRFGIGVNSIDLEAASECKTVVLFMPGFCVEELAAHAASLILALIRNTAYYDRHIRMGEWPKASYYTPAKVSELTVGLYGFGGSARLLYQIFREGFGARVIACDPYLAEEVKGRYDAEFVDFDTLLGQSDVISIHAPLNKETRHIFGRDAFCRMKRGAMIVNIARGGLIDEEALVKALDEGEIRFAGLDVFETEPLRADSPLRERDDVVLTCHSAFYGTGSKKQQLAWARELVVEALNEGRVRKEHVANRDVMKKETGFQFI